ncbi:MarR family transcriptional regulator [Erwinia persicina]|uniref:MarR family winged helix-turn-helix transcriptional regulator n=1 Tax=Erwinia persicina TaxID=55211 RepID=UPI000E523822|nr:MarR family transcriptional regulator [Erwinia persicina]AXU97205.1 MarR family transcriptional regulator [Erwinia persicina]
MNNSSRRPPRDAVDTIIEQWQRERPDLDASPMGPIGRLKRCTVLLEQQLEAWFSRFDLASWEFDMLATLRRAGAPHCLSPTALFSALMVTSGTMTHRLKRLETRGLVARVANAEDARSTLVQLTPAGLALINRVVGPHIENERQILSALPAGALAQLDASLSTLLLALEAGNRDSDLPE